MRCVINKRELWEGGFPVVIKGGDVYRRRRKTKRQVIEEFKRKEGKGLDKMGVNKVIIVGNLGQAPEMRFTPNGAAVTSLRVAASRRYYDQGKNLVEETEWFNVVVWGNLAERCNQYLVKGRLVYVEGRLQTRSWEGKSGAQMRKTEVVANNVQFLGKGASDVSSEDMAVVDQLGEVGIEAEVESVEFVKPVPKPSSGKTGRKIIKKGGSEGV